MTPTSLISTQAGAYRSLRLGPAFLRRMDSFAADLDDLADRARAADTQNLNVSLVIPHPIAPMDRMITHLRLPDEPSTGIFDRNFDVGDTHRYRPVDPVPDDRPYLVVGFDPGSEFRDQPPAEVVPIIRARGRRPMTISEGLAVFLHDPQTLQPNHCWSLAGSSRGDRRVPALWISNKAPKLGWCFAGAPHSWLGTASIRERILLDS